MVQGKNVRIWALCYSRKGFSKSERDDDKIPEKLDMIAYDSEEHGKFLIGCYGDSINNYMVKEITVKINSEEHKSFLNNSSRVF